MSPKEVVLHTLSLAKKIRKTKKSKPKDNEAMQSEVQEQAMESSRVTTQSLQ
jgi:hypothetical protein